MHFYLYLLFPFLYCLCLTQFLFHSQHFFLTVERSPGWPGGTLELDCSGPLIFTMVPCTVPQLLAFTYSWTGQNSHFGLLFPSCLEFFIVLRSCCFSAPSHADSSDTPVLWLVGGLFPLLIFILGSVVFLYSLVLL